MKNKRKILQIITMTLFMAGLGTGSYLGAADANINEQDLHYSNITSGAIAEGGHIEAVDAQTEEVSIPNPSQNNQISGFIYKDESGEYILDSIVKAEEPQEKDLGVVTTAETSTIVTGEGSTAYTIPSYEGFKSYERYTKLLGGKQKELQDRASTDEEGFRRLDGLYMIAIGTHFNAAVGQKVTLVLADGSAVDCVVGDIKADADTDDNNIFTVHSKCCSEFIVDVDRLDPEVRQSGNISTIARFSAPVIQIITYNGYC